MLGLCSGERWIIIPDEKLKKKKKKWSGMRVFGVINPYPANVENTVSS